MSVNQQVAGRQDGLQGVTVVPGRDSAVGAEDARLVLANRYKSRRSSFR